jgi:nucleotide-binding universal stress UspA family protein
MSRPTLPQTIIVPLDGSHVAERAAPHGASLARRLGADLILATTAWNGNTEVPARYLNKLSEVTDHEAVRVTVIEGEEPVEGIASLVSSIAGSMVVMSSHGHGGLRAAVLGSTADGVLRRSSRPILFIGPSCRYAVELEDSSVLIAGYDGSTPSALAVDAALDWAGALGLTFQVVEICPLGTDPDRLAGIAAHLDRVIRRARDGRGPDGVDVTVEALRDTSASKELVRLAEREGAACIVVGATGAGGIERLLGSVTADVIRHAPCPVLAVPGPVEPGPG